MPPKFVLYCFPNVPDRQYVIMEYMAVKNGSFGKEVYCTSDYEGAISELAKLSGGPVMLAHSVQLADNTHKI